jgi:hypothetical protein
MYARHVKYFATQPGVINEGTNIIKHGVISRRDIINHGVKWA